MGAVISWPEPMLARGTEWMLKLAIPSGGSFRERRGARTGARRRMEWQLAAWRLAESTTLQLPRQYATRTMKARPLPPLVSAMGV